MGYDGLHAEYEKLPRGNPLKAPPIRTIMAMEWTSGTAGCILRDVAPCAAPKIDKVIKSIFQSAGIIGIEKKHTMSYLDFLRPKQQNWCGLKAEMSQVARQQAR